MRYLDLIETAGVGIIVKGVNTTCDVGPDELNKQLKKFGFEFGKDGPPLVNEEEDEMLADVKTYSPTEIAKKHNVPLQQIINELKMGVLVELEHTTNLKLAREIALDHLLELPDYYTRLTAMENDN